jgi:fatty acid desaturase
MTMLTSEELRGLNQNSAIKSISALLFDWLVIFSAVLISIHFDRVVFYFIAMVFVARSQLALGIIVHEAAHARLFRSKFWNNFVGHVFAAAPFFFSLNVYRRTHLRHHQIPLTSDDPDLTLTGGYPISKRSFVRKLLRDLFGISYLKFVKHFLKAAWRPRNQKIPQSVSCQNLETMSAIQETFWMFLVNLFIFLAFFMLGHPALYFILWIFPTITVLQFLLRIRGVAEHGGYKPNQNQALLSRTVVNPIQQFFFAPHNVNYHIEHHIYPGIPFFNLPKVHKIFKEKDLLPLSNIYSSYWVVFREITRG